MALTKATYSMIVGSVVNVFDYMTTAEIADVTARTSGSDVTSAVRAALTGAPDSSAVYFPAGEYSIGNITIPSKKLTLFGDGRFQSVLTARSDALSSNDYFVASSAYVENSTFGSEPIVVQDLGFSGAGLTDNVFVLYGYYSRLTDCSFSGPTNTGAALLMTSDGISGSACSTTLVENRIDHCNIQGADASTYAFRIKSSGQKTTDAFISDNIIRNGSVLLTAMAGTVFDNNHLYANAAVTIGRLSIGSRVSNNYFEDAINIDDCLDFNVQVNDNTFLGRVTLSFGNSGTIITLNDNTFQGSADLYHNYFSATKHAVVNGGSFATSTPVVFSSGTSTGRVTFNRVFNKGLGYEQDGSRTANTGRISLVSWGAAAPTTGDWNVGDKVINTTPTAGGNIGWVCTTAGAPGTWKTFGAITA